MKTGLIRISIAIFIVSIIIYVVKNNKKIKPILTKIFKPKYFKIVYVIAFMFAIICAYKNVKKIINNIDSYNDIKENNIMFAECDNKIANERSFYNSIIELNYDNQDYSKPYILEGFEYVTGEWNTGFVIKDQNGNEFVWVPCTNLENKDAPKIEKRYFFENTLISKDFCYDIEYEEFLNSALENGGFYISRYEIGKENDTPVSKPEVEIYSYVTQEEAIELAKNMYKSNSFKSELINGYAYDTVFAWILGSNNLVDNNNTIAADKYYTKRDNSYNNIFDIFDNILEITMEKNYNTVVTRGVYGKKAFENYYMPVANSNENRYSILENDSNESTTFRIVLYK